MGAIGGTCPNCCGDLLEVRHRETGASATCFFCGHPLDESRRQPRYIAAGLGPPQEGRAVPPVPSFGVALSCPLDVREGLSA